MSAGPEQKRNCNIKKIHWNCWGGTIRIQKFPNFWGFPARGPQKSPQNRIFHVFSTRNHQISLESDPFLNFFREKISFFSGFFRFPGLDLGGPGLDLGGPGTIFQFLGPYSMNLLNLGFPGFSRISSRKIQEKF